MVTLHKKKPIMSESMPSIVISKFAAELSAVLKGAGCRKPITPCVGGNIGRNGGFRASPQKEVKNWGV